MASPPPPPGYVARWVTLDGAAIAGPRLPPRALGAAALVQPDCVQLLGGLVPSGTAPAGVTSRLCLSDLSHVPHTHAGATLKGASRLAPALFSLYWGDSRANAFTVMVGNGVAPPDPARPPGGAALPPRPDEPHVLAHALLPVKQRSAAAAVGAGAGAGDAAALWVEVKTEWVHSPGDDGGGPAASEQAAPPARTGAAFCCRKSRLFMFGGLGCTPRQPSTGRGGGGGGASQGGRPRYLSDLGYLSFASSTSPTAGQWKSFSRPPDVSVDDWPAPRAHAALLFIEAKSPLVLLHGGEGATGPLNDTWLCRLGARLDWTRVDVTGSPLRRRVGGFISHVALPSHDAAGAALLCGGRSAGARSGGGGGGGGGGGDDDDGEGGGGAPASAGSSENEWDIRMIGVPRDAWSGSGAVAVACLGAGAPSEAWEAAARGVGGASGSGGGGPSTGKRAPAAASAAAHPLHHAFDTPPPPRWGAQCVCLDECGDGTLRHDPGASKLGRLLLERFRALGQLAAPHAPNKRLRGAAASAHHADYGSHEWALDAVAASSFVLVSGGLSSGGRLLDDLHVLCLIPTHVWPMTQQQPASKQQPAGGKAPPASGRFYEDGDDGRDSRQQQQQQLEHGVGPPTLPSRPAVGLLPTGGPAAATAAAAGASRGGGAVVSKLGAAGAGAASTTTNTTALFPAGAHDGHAGGSGGSGALMQQVRVLLQQLDGTLSALAEGAGVAAAGGGAGGSALAYQHHQQQAQAQLLRHQHPADAAGVAALVQPVVHGAVSSAIDVLRSEIKATVGALRTDLRGDLSRLEGEVSGSRSGYARVDSALEALAAQRARGEHSERERKDAAGRIVEALEGVQAAQGGLAGGLDKLRGELAGMDAKANEAIRAQTEAVTRLAGAQAELRAAQAQLEQLRKDATAAASRAAAAEARLAERDARAAEGAAELAAARDDKRAALERAAAAEDRLRAVVEAAKR